MNLDRLMDRLTDALLGFGLIVWLGCVGWSAWRLAEQVISRPEPLGLLVLAGFIAGALGFLLALLDMRRRGRATS